MKKLLFVNACVRKNSRTKQLAEYLLSKLDGEIIEIRLSEVDFPLQNENFLFHRDQLVENKCFDDPIFEFTRQFATADQIVIAAPYWDMSFPAVLKQYLEQVSIVDVTFTYTAEGIPKGLCKAKHLYYVTTAGGYYTPDEYGFGYVEALCKSFYGIPDVKLIKATGLDIVGADVENILAESKKEIDCIINSELKTNA